MRSYSDSEEEEDGGFGLDFLFDKSYNADDGIFAGMFSETFTVGETSDKIEIRPSERDLSVYVGIIRDIQMKTPEELLAEGWQEVTPEEMRNNTESREFLEPKSGLRIRFDKGIGGTSGFGGKDHYHVYNPNCIKKSSGSYLYLDINGQPANRGSKESHIVLNKGGK